MAELEEVGELPRGPRGALPAEVVDHEEASRSGLRPVLVPSGDADLGRGKPYAGLLGERPRRGVRFAAAGRTEEVKRSRDRIGEERLDGDGGGLGAGMAGDPRRPSGGGGESGGDRGRVERPGGAEAGLAPLERLPGLLGVSLPDVLEWIASLLGEPADSSEGRSHRETGELAAHGDTRRSSASSAFAASSCERSSSTARASS